MVKQSFECNEKFNTKINIKNRLNSYYFAKIKYFGKTLIEIEGNARCLLK